ncbi:histone-lysine N-methyltransferase PRDM9-like [Heptranchias perlo]|uniref:histone-lysine N-methyltransferase PRDM9-like n=1 Tax=Heptranchias perlo TaxID=212740 RepID=UPI003559EA63
MSREVGVNSRTCDLEQEWLFCEDCQEFFVDTCPVHGPPLFIRDYPVAHGVPYWALHSLPYGLALGPSEDPDQGLGIWCTMKTIPKGAIFGPLEGDVFDKDKVGFALHSWIMRHFSVKCKSKESESNWMRYANSARNRTEQNAVPFLYKDLVYFRVCKPIEPGSALLVWFDEQDAGHSEAWESLSKSTDLETECDLNVVVLDVSDKDQEEETASVQEAGNLTSPPPVSDSQPRPGKKYKCGQCPYSTGRRGHFFDHYRTHTSVRPFKCDICGKAFKRIQHLKLHMDYHRNERPHKCEECGKAFVQPGDLRIHGRIHSGEKPHTCLVCAKGFAQMANLRAHQKIHLNGKTHVCLMCNKSYKRPSSLQLHLLTHQGADNLECPECGKQFKGSGELHRHLRVHTGEKPYQCPDCGKSFTRAAYLETHRYTHTGVKQYLCSECGKSFNDFACFQAHLRAHRGEKPYECSYCDKGYTLLKEMKKHQRIHTGERPFACGKCGKAFRVSQHLRKHLNVHRKRDAKTLPCNQGSEMEPDVQET